MSQKPEVVRKEELSAQDAKWVTLEKLTWKDQDGKERAWESASRKTRGKSGVDAVAVLAILKSKSASFRPSTVIIEQYRPPVGAYVIELPAGLIDSGETAEQTAIRELEEETGYKASVWLRCRRCWLAIQLVAVNVDLNEGEEPAQN
ncbi:NUDIX family hydrolase [Ceratobasidium sp. AG-Ba]|nr:NUDIX family hydrolase [Ceratobasidium sp. AG-Ba]